ncbi:GNAT family N-acetyltransferase [Sphingomonas quercus]|uniref:Acetyltransferase n=1 Tax=Sphingomonas quercus TaxID=2842451 RepID=A0ABS6BE29_9SPHN|nr:GNAT family N-acetyltransferase [Sphingomonas quercus]MBU3076414.1 acetyltransferase [Sphingomonas quercus]
MQICGEEKEIAIRLVESTEKIQAACDLINDRYAWRGYGSSHHIPEDANHMTFTAEVEEEVVGTITLAVDSAQGLAADRAFKDELDAFRDLPGVKLCELTKFAFDPAVQSRELMAALFHIVFVYGHRTHGCTDLLIEVNPRHVRFYEAMLGFQRLGAVRTNEGVDAPAQLMWLKVAAIREQINCHAATQDRPSSRSLYPFFFSPAEENGIYQRLTRAIPQPHANDTYDEVEIAPIPGVHIVDAPSLKSTFAKGYPIEAAA